MIWLKKNLLIGASLFILFLAVGCDKYYVSVAQQWIDVRYLASTHVKTPDPRQDHPPVGQMMIVDWRVPKELLRKKPRIQLTILFWNYTEKIITFPINQRMGWVTYKILDEEYDQTKGILTYKAEITDEDGSLFREWKHQLWVELITVKENDPL
jgi:hypothetical protein